ERRAAREQFEAGARRQPLEHEIAELLREVSDGGRERERRKRVAERRKMLPQDVTAQDAHGWSRHYIRNPKSLQGMRRLAQIVGLALTLVVPRVHAQAPVYTFGVPPLAPLRNPALAPGGRLGARVPPSLLARAWAARVLAQRPPLFGAATAVPPQPPPTATILPQPPAAPYA